MVGRHQEKMALLDAVERTEAQFVAVYGRRRIGKTYLVREVFNDDFCFYHTGISGVGTTDQLLDRSAIRHARHFVQFSNLVVPVAIKLGAPPILLWVAIAHQARWGRSVPLGGYFR